METANRWLDERREDGETTALLYAEGADEHHVLQTQQLSRSAAAGSRTRLMSVGTSSPRLAPPTAQMLEQLQATPSPGGDAAVVEAKRQELRAELERAHTELLAALAAADTAAGNARIYNVGKY